MICNNNGSPKRLCKSQPFQTHVSGPDPVIDGVKWEAPINGRKYMVTPLKSNIDTQKYLKPPPRQAKPTSKTYSKTHKPQLVFSLLCLTQSPTWAPPSTLDELPLATCAMVKSRVSLGMVIPPLNRESLQWVYKPLRTWVDEFIPYYMEISWDLIDPIAHTPRVFSFL